MIAPAQFSHPATTGGGQVAEDKSVVTVCRMQVTNHQPAVIFPQERFDELVVVLDDVWSRASA